MAGMTHPTRSLSAQSPPGAPEREAALEQPKELNLCQALDWARHHLVKRWSCQLEIRDLAAAPDQWALSVSAHLAMPGRSLKEQDGLSDAHPEGGSPRRRAAQCGHRSLMESRSEGRRAAAAKVAGKPRASRAQLPHSSFGKWSPPGKGRGLSSPGALPPGLATSGASLCWRLKFSIYCQIPSCFSFPSPAASLSLSPGTRSPTLGMRGGTGAWPSAWGCELLPHLQCEPLCSFSAPLCFIKPF